MLNYLRIFASIVFLLGAAYSFVMSIIATYKNFEHGRMTKRAAKVGFLYSCGFAVCGFLAFEIYHPDFIGVPLLTLFLAVNGFGYLMNLLSMYLQEKATKKLKGNGEIK